VIDSLQAPLLRVTGFDVPYPLAALEHMYLPSVEKIVQAVNKVIAY
jgi:pyruvate dehydrogenase E1 component beta subunit